MTSPKPEAFDDTDLAIGRVSTANLEAVLESVENYRELERQNEQLDEFTGIVSHDFQNPLSVAMGFLDLLENRIGDADDRERARESLDHMDEIITVVLWLASEGDQVGELEPVSLRRSAERSWSLVETGGATLAADGELQLEADPSTFTACSRTSSPTRSNRAAPMSRSASARSTTAGVLRRRRRPRRPSGATRLHLRRWSHDQRRGDRLRAGHRRADRRRPRLDRDVAESEAGGARFVVRT